MIVVTSGSLYIDIDAYASAIGLAELLIVEGKAAYATSTAPLNKSIPQSLRELESIGLAEYTPSDNDEFILVDLSKESHFDPIVKNGTIIEVIDHHPGQESYWAEKTGVKTDIEFIGASCTQIFERWQKSGKLAEMKPAVATLLAAGILDNTLNFNAEVTTDRDRHAYNTLVQAGSLPADFAALYFTECQAAIDGDVESAVRNDTKILDEAPLLPHALGQLTVWDAQTFVSGKRKKLEKAFDDAGSDWGLNLISISEGRSYLIAASPQSQAKFRNLLSLEFKDGIAVANRLWLRKELLKLALETAAA